MQGAHQLDIQQVTAERFEDLAALFRTGLARVCWDMEPRQTAAEDAACRRRWRAEGTSQKDGRRQAFLDLLARAHMPGLLAYRKGQAVGWVSIGPRSDYPRIERSRALPPLDDLAVWAIPCVRASGRAGPGRRGRVAAGGGGACRSVRCPGRGRLSARRDRAHPGRGGLLRHGGHVHPSRLRGRAAVPARSPRDLGASLHHAGSLPASTPMRPAGPERLGLGVAGPSASRRVGCWSRSRRQ